MAWLAVDKNGDEAIYAECPKRFIRFGDWDCSSSDYSSGGFCFVELPKGTIKKLIGKSLTWEDDPVELKEE